MNTKNIKSFLMFVSKHLFVGVLMVCGAIMALYGVQAFQSLTPSSSTGSIGAADSFNSSLTSPLLTRSTTNAYNRNASSLEAISQKLDSLGANISNYTPSDILNRNQVAALETAMSNKSMFRCYSSIIHGWLLATFHSRCDGIGNNNLRIFKTDTGKIYGVYIAGNNIGASWRWNASSFEFSFTGDAITIYPFKYNCTMVGYANAEYGDSNYFFTEAFCHSHSYYWTQYNSSGYPTRTTAIPLVNQIPGSGVAWNVYGSALPNASCYGSYTCSNAYNHFSSSTASNVAQYLGAAAWSSVIVSVIQAEAFYNF